MREWQKPTIDETSPAWRSRATCQPSWIALNRSAHLGRFGRRSGVSPGRRFGLRPHLGD